MKLRPFWRYYGGKWKAAPRYPAPEHDTIVEPFAGAAGYSLRFPDRNVILVDAYEPVAGIWSYLIRAKSSEILSLPDVPEEGTVDDMPICQEARWLVGMWCQAVGKRPCKQITGWAKSRREADPLGTWGPSARARIASQVDRIRHWRIIHGDYSDAPDVEATWFVDPPYQVPAGREYTKQPADFDALGRWVQSRRGFVIACDMEGADWLPWTGSPGRLHSAHQLGAHKCRDVIYTQGSRNALPLGYSGGATGEDE